MIELEITASDTFVLQGQYRRAEALRGLGRNEEALIALLFCSALEKSPQSDICTEIAKVLTISFFKNNLLCNRDICS